MKYVYGEDVLAVNEYVGDLETKSEAARNVAQTLDQFIEDSKTVLMGEVYDTFRLNLEVYRDMCNKLSQVCLNLADAMNTENSSFGNYISACPDGDPVDMRKLNWNPDGGYYFLKKFYKDSWDYYAEEIWHDGPDLDGDGIPDSRWFGPRDSNLATQYKELYEDIVIKIDYIETLPERDARALNVMDSAYMDVSKLSSEINSINVSNIS